MTVGTLPVAEVFGPTWQGEGPSAGQVAAFVRLGGCNLTCARCDSAFTWDASRYRLRDELTPMTAAEILGRLPDTPLVVVTGGEPTLYQHLSAFQELIDGLVYRRRIEVETNGTRVPGEVLTRWASVSFNVSPKLDGPLSVDPEPRRNVPGALAAYARLARQGRAVFKLVVSDVADVDAVAELVNRFGVPHRKVWVMPEGTTETTVLETARKVADTAMGYGFNLTLRQHVLLWPGEERGR